MPSRIGWLAISEEEPSITMNTAWLPRLARLGEEARAQLAGGADRAHRRDRGQRGVDVVLRRDPHHLQLGRRLREPDATQRDPRRARSSPRRRGAPAAPRSIGSSMPRRPLASPRWRRAFSERPVGGRGLRLRGLATPGADASRAATAAIGRGRDACASLRRPARPPRRQRAQRHRRVGRRRVREHDVVRQFDVVGEAVVVQEPGHHHRQRAACGSRG